MKRFAIFGTIVDTDDMRYAIEDVTPNQFRAFTKNLADGEEIEIQINSPGGSVFAGIAIANMIRQLSIEGHKVTAKVEGLAASIASVIMCAADKVIMPESAVCMIHNCWSVVQGDSTALRKEAETMDILNEAIVSFYLSKFDLSRDTLKEMMNNETWFSGKEAQTFNFKCEVTPDEKDFSIAAKVKSFDLAKFNKTPKALMDMIMENEIKNEEIDSTVSTIDQEEVEAIEKQVHEQIEEPKAEEPKVEKPVEDEPKAENKIESLPMDEVEKRVSGMQSTMAKKMDAMKKEYDAKIVEFENQLKVKDEELTTAKNEVISLNQKLEDANKELQATVSALEEKSNALATLNANVLTPTETKESWRTLKGKAFLDYVNAHKKELSK